MKRELKRQIREDEFRSGLERAALWMGAHKDEVRITAVALVVLAVGGGVLHSYQSQKAQEAEKAFAEALEIFHAPLAGEVPEGFETPSTPVFQAAAEKHKKAVTAFDGIERRYGSQSAGRRARYYGALCRIELEEYDEARKTLTDLAAQGDSDKLLPALSRLGLAHLARREGDLGKAADAYRQILEDPAQPLPKDYALMSLASVLEEAGRTEEARAAYRRLADEHPASPYAQEARRQAEHLDSPAQG